MSKLMVRIAAAFVFSAALLGGTLPARPAYADHESRDRVLGEVGVEVVLVALVLIAAVVMVGAFAATILRWERQGAEATEQRGLSGRQDDRPIAR